MKKTITIPESLVNAILYALIAILSQCYSGTASAQDSSYVNYLSKNHEKINLNGSNKFDLFDTAFYNNQLFLLTESHGYAKPHNIDAELFMQLNKKTGLRYYIAEVDFAQAYYINQYLSTGNETLLRSIYQNWFEARAQWGCTAGFEKWKKLYQYNLTLAKNKRIIVLGLDEAQDLDMNEKMIVELLGKAKYKTGTNVMMDSLGKFAMVNIAKDTTRLFQKFAKRLVADMEKNEKAYKKLLKDQFFPIDFTLENIAVRKNREERIFYNFNLFYNTYNLSKEKIYGFWGRFHGMQDSINGGMSFSGMLKNSNLALKNKIISIPVFCVESASMLPTAFLPPMAQQKGTIFTKSDMVNDDSFVYTVSGIKDLRKYVGKNENVLFKLNGTSSPYNKGLKLVESTSQFDPSFNWKGNKSAATTEYFQYAFVVSNSDWAGPFGDNTEAK